jgi:uncharacterized membrane protein
MGVLLLGLVLFLGAHSVRIVAEPWRARTIERVGEKAWKGAYTLVSLAGFALLLWGFGLARQAPALLWTPPVWTRHLAALLMLPALVLLVAAYVPRNQIKARLHHPMVLGVKVWAFGHLVANQWLHEAVLFGAFLIWALLSYRAAQARDRAAAAAYAAGQWPMTLLTLVVGVLVWAALAFWLHEPLFGVRPFGGA